MLRIDTYRFLISMLILLPGYAFRTEAQISIHREQSEWYKTHPCEDAGESVPVYKSLGEDTCKLQKMVFGYHPYWAGTAWQEYHWNLVSDLCYFSYEVNPLTGNPETLNGWDTNPLIDVAKQNGVKVHLCVTLFSGHRTFFNNPEAMNSLIINCISQLKARNADGVNLDFEAVPADLSVIFNNYLSAFADSVHRAIPGSVVSFASPAVDWNGLMNIPLLSQHLDYFMIMGYDYYWNSSLQAGPVAGFFPMTADYQYSLSRTLSYYLSAGAPAGKLLLGLPYYGRDWPVVAQMAPSATTSAGTAITYRNFRNNPSAYSLANQHWEPHSLSLYYSYYLDRWRQCFIDDQVSLGSKYEMVKRSGIAGIGIWALSYDRGYTELWNLIRDKFTDCSKAICSDTLYDSGGPAFSYYLGEKFVQTISGSEKEPLTLEFTEFALNPDDTLFIFDGPDTLSALIGSYHGSGMPPFITAGNNSLTIRFVSGSGGPALGWKAIYRCPTAGVDHTLDAQLAAVSPNPFRNHFVISYQADSDGWLSLGLYNVAGEKIFSRNALRVSKGPNQWNAAELGIPGHLSGVFLLKLTCSSGTSEVLKLIAL